MESQACIDRTLLQAHILVLNIYYMSPKVIFGSKSQVNTMEL